MSKPKVGTPAFGKQAAARKAQNERGFVTRETAPPFPGSQTADMENVYPDIGRTHSGQAENLRQSPPTDPFAAPVATVRRTWKHMTGRRHR